MYSNHATSPVRDERAATLDQSSANRPDSPPKSEGRIRLWIPTLIVFAATALLLWWRLADRMSLSILDEGIYLDGAERILNGQVPYRDFFVLTGPGTFWVEAAVFRVTGVSFQAARSILVLDIAFLSAAVFWLTSQFVKRRVAAVTTFAFLGLEVANPGVLNVNHRWDSCAFGLAGVVLLFSALGRSNSNWKLIVGGTCIALSAWTTPTLLALVVVAALALLILENWKALCWYASGVAIFSSVAALLLLRQHALGAMLQHLFWSGNHYTSAHGFSYGRITGGYFGIFESATKLELPVRALIVLVLVLPAILPLLNFAIAPLQFRMKGALEPFVRKRLLFLAAASFALWIAAYPWFLGQLTCVAALAYVLAAVLFRQVLNRLRPAVLLLVTILPAAFLLLALQRGATIPVQTRVGQVHLSQADTAGLSLVTSHVHPGDTLFVFPYKPILYFVTGGLNPTRYSFLQPGMMSDEDESNALADLTHNPPRWIIYEDVSPKSYLRIWPASDPKRLRMRKLEDFIRSRYELRDEGHFASETFQLREYRPESTPQSPSKLTDIAH